jgi:hypothetical protein
MANVFSEGTKAMQPVNLTPFTPPRPPTAPLPAPGTPMAARFEQMLWAEMLSHAGLEDALTLGGGDGAAAFSRYIVEDIAADLAARHPLGLAAR